MDHGRCPGAIDIPVVLGYHRLILKEKGNLRNGRIPFRKLASLYNRVYAAAIHTGKRLLMDNVNKTLYIPLYGKAYVSRRGLLLQDKKAEEIWEKEGFSLKGKGKSKWIAYNMAMRSVVFDCWTRRQLQVCPHAVVLHLGCGLDSRCIRVKTRGCQWFDVDFPEVMVARKQYFEEIEGYHMVGADIREEAWLARIPGDRTAIIIMEGVSIYLTPEELKAVLRRWNEHFREVHILLDSYTVFGTKAAKYKNPIHEVGVTQVYGLEDPRKLEEGSGLSFVRELSLTPAELIKQLPKWEQGFFRAMFAGKLAKKIYRLYEYQ